MLRQRKLTTVSVGQGEDLGESFSQAHGTVALEKRAHLLWQTLASLVEEHTDTRLAAPSRSAHLFTHILCIGVIASRA